MKILTEITHASYKRLNDSLKHFSWKLSCILYQALHGRASINKIELTCTEKQDGVKITCVKRHGYPGSSVFLLNIFDSLEQFVPSKGSENWKHTIPSTLQHFFGNNRTCSETSCIFRWALAACLVIRLSTGIKRFILTVTIDISFDVEKTFSTQESNPRTVAKTTALPSSIRNAF